jgi:hypothetical protein
VSTADERRRRKRSASTPIRMFATMNPTPRSSRSCGVRSEIMSLACYEVARLAGFAAKVGSKHARHRAS